MELFKIHFNKPDNSKTVVKYYRITPYHVSSGGQESKTINSVKLMSRRENKKNWPKPTYRTWTKPCKNYGISDL